MGILDYYRRTNDDGSHETICTRCFATVGRANTLALLAQMEAEHLCPARRRSRADRPASAVFVPRATPFPTGMDRFFINSGGMHLPQTLLMLCAGVLCFYIFPSVIEVELVKHLSVWVACILVGDLAGCSFVSLVCGMKKTGVLLYLFLTASEGSLYELRIFPRSVLVWTVDLVPTLLVVALIVAASYRAAHSQAGRLAAS